MTFTALHRALGLAPSPLTNEILNAAIEARMVETDDLDWKSELPPTRNLHQTDVPKDIAAMANSGGGIIVYGVTESQKAATGRRDTGEFTEIHERALRSVAVTAISPPVFRLEIHRLGDADPRAVAVVIPASIDGPHLIYKNDYFGAPVRNDADTSWMKERQIETMYRARFDERRHTTEAIDNLYEESLEGRHITERAWLIAVAHPRIPGIARPDRDEARSLLEKSKRLTLMFSNSNGVHPIHNVDILNPRPGLRRWVAVNEATGERSRWHEAWATIHHDGSVTLAAAIGGHRKSVDGYFEGWQVEEGAIESAIADFMALVRVNGETVGGGEYETRVGIEWRGPEPLSILTTDSSGYTYDGVSTPLHRYTSIRSTVVSGGSDVSFHQAVYTLAQDCVNQGGVTYLRVISDPVLE